MERSEHELHMGMFFFSPGSSRSTVSTTQPLQSCYQSTWICRGHYVFINGHSSARKTNKHVSEAVCRRIITMSLMFGKVKTCNSAECNLVLLGVMGVGKSALAVKFLTKRFISEYDPHLEDIYSSEETVDQQSVTVRLMDTCDQEGPVNSERYLLWANAFLVVYSIDNTESFKGSQLYLQTLALHSKTFKPQSPIILLGNKLDMDRYRQHVFYEAVRRARCGGERSRLVPAVCVSEDKALLSAPFFTTPWHKELPAPATARLVTVKASRAQSKRKAATLTLLKGFKIF